ncbi:MAG: glycosyl hydrolase [Alphaproteobacteria bacterium]|nr:glycosyl hydrolase [Alphaproteobacteria bacterium]
MLLSFTTIIPNHEDDREETPMAITLSPGGETTFKSSVPSNEVLVGTKDGIVRLKRDGPGAKWQSAERWLAGKHVHAILIEPKTGAILAGLNQGSVLASEDGGKTWTSRDKGLSDVTDIYCFAANQVNGKTRIYVGTEPAHLFYSDDLGRNWIDLPALRSVDMSKWNFPGPPFVAHVKHVAFHPKDPNTLLVSIEQGGLLKSTDGGRSFAYLRGMDDDVHRAVIDPVNPERIYVPGGNGTYVTQDGGKNWEHRMTIQHETGGYPDFMIAHPRNRDLVFIAAAEQEPGQWMKTKFARSRISKSADGGRTWTILKNGLPERLRSAFEAMTLEDRGDSFALYAATTSGEVFASEDGGEHWTEIASGLPAVSKGSHDFLLQQ